MLAGVASYGFGLPSGQAYAHSFTTEIRSVRLNVPYYAQQRAASCTAASLRMMLAYRGIHTDEMSAIYKMGYKPRNANTSGSVPKWDDPSQMFVGYVDGGAMWHSAGPDAPPVAKAARGYGRSAQDLRGISAEWIAQQIHAGNPVMMFGSTKYTGFISWQTPSGRMARMNISSHVTVVYGVAGEPGSPVGFWVHDPRYGTSYWSLDEVRANIARDAYAQAVVVY